MRKQYRARYSKYAHLCSFYNLVWFSSSIKFWVTYRKRDNPPFRNNSNARWGRSNHSNHKLAFCSVCNSTSVWLLFFNSVALLLRQTQLSLPRLIWEDFTETLVACSSRRWKEDSQNPMLPHTRLTVSLRLGGVIITEFLALRGLHTETYHICGHYAPDGTPI